MAKPAARRLLFAGVLRRDPGEDPKPRFGILGLSQGGSISIRFAVSHPERVSHLVLVNAYGQGGRTRARADVERLEAETLVNFVRIGWGRENPAFCQFFANLFIPDGTDDQHRWWGDLERMTASPDVAAKLLNKMQGIDVLDLASRVKVPTLILHCFHDLPGRRAHMEHFYSAHPEATAARCRVRMGAK